MLTIEVWTLIQCNEELTCIRIGALIGHGQAACLRVPSLKVLIDEIVVVLVCVDGSTTSTILRMAQVAALNHELINYAVK